VEPILEVWGVLHYLLLETGEYAHLDLVQFFVSLACFNAVSVPINVASAIPKSSAFGTWPIVA